MSVPDTMKMKDLLLKFVHHLGKNENHLGKDLIFLYNAVTIDIKEERNIIECGLSNNSSITVVDQTNILGDISKLFIKV